MPGERFFNSNVVRRKLGCNWPQADAALGVIAELTEPVRPLAAGIDAQAMKLARSNSLSRSTTR